jgi:hypothetical protein
MINQVQETSAASAASGVNLPPNNAGRRRRPLVEHSWQSKDRTCGINRVTNRSHGNHRQRQQWKEHRGNRSTAIALLQGVNDLFFDTTSSLKLCGPSSERVSPVLRCVRSEKRQRPASFSHKPGHGIRMGSHCHHANKVHLPQPSPWVVRRSSNYAARIVRHDMPWSTRRGTANQRIRDSQRSHAIFLVNVSRRLVRQCCLS